MKKRLSALLVIAAAFAQCGAQAAIIDNMNGAVRFSAAQGHGFSAASVGTQLAPGDTVMASQKSSAQINYGNGCVVDLLPGEMMVIKSKAPCGARAKEMRAQNVPPQCDPNDPTCCDPNNPNNNNSLLCGFGFGGGYLGPLLVLGAVGGGIGAAIATSSSSTTQPPFFFPPISP